MIGGNRPMTGCDRLMIDRNRHGNFLTASPLAAARSRVSPVPGSSRAG
jgi:hypothetical protein